MKRLHCILLAVMGLVYANVSFAQNISPAAVYQILNESGYAMSYSEGKCQLAEVNADDVNQQWYIEETSDDKYMLKNVGETKFLGLIHSAVETWDTWSCYFYDEEEVAANLDYATYTIEDLGDGYYGFQLKVNSKYLGLDSNTPGSSLYCDKAISNYGKWTLVALVSDAALAYRAAYSNVEDYCADMLVDYPEIANMVVDSLMAVDSKYYDVPDRTDELLDQGTIVLQNLLRNLKAARANITQMDTKLAEMEYLLTETTYPGLVELNAAYSKFGELLSGAITYVDALEGPAAMDEVIKNYHLSQVATATEDTPADLTYFVKNPSFRKERLYSETCTITSEGWTTHTVELPSSGYDIGAKNKEEEEVGKNISCFNMWSWQFAEMSVSQELNGLPEGRYKISCMGWTADGIVAQRAFATSSAGITVESAHATEQMKTVDWESFTTQTINVSDGYLKIGFISDKEEIDGCDGWFLVTDFKLLYVGPLGTSSIHSDLQARLAVAEGLELSLQGDKDALAAAIASAKTVTEDANVSEIQAALSALNEAIDAAQKSVDTYESFMSGAYASYVEYMNTFEEGDAKTMMDAILKNADAVLVADTATRGAVVELTAKLNASKAYVALYADRAASVLTEYTVSEEAAAKLNALVSANWTALPTASSKEITAMTSALTVAINDALLTQPAGENTEMSFLIVNADVTDSGDNYATGWDVNKGNGNKYTNTSQSFTKDAADRYIDSWNEVEGALKFTAKQTIYNLPNGTYRMKVATRADGEHAYIFAVNSDDVLYKTEIINNGASGGAIYQAAYDKAYQDAIDSGMSEDDIFEYELEVLYANNGWNWAYVDNIEVKNHELTIGVSTDSEVTLEEAFTGTWFSADKFALYYLAAGDNSDFGYTTPVDEVEGERIAISVADGRIVVGGAENVRIYSANGVRVAKDTVLPKGLYIVCAQGKNYKVMVK